MYNKIVIENFRGIKHLKIGDFRQVNLFVGKNNCGKTTLLEALFLLTGPTNAELPIKINAFRDFTIIDENSWRLIFNKLDVNSNIKISGELEKEKRNLIIRPNTKSVTMLPKTTIDKGRVDIKDSYSGLFRAIDGLILEYSLTKTGNKKPKKIATKVVMKGPGIEVMFPKDYKELLKGVFINAKTISVDIAGRFNNIQIRKQSNRIINVLRQIEPSLDDLSLGADGIIYCDIGLNRLMPVNVMGDGMFRLLSIILAISDTENGIILIDEIENGFHHSSQELLWEAIFISAKEFNVQIFATTHSIECVKAFSSSYFRKEKNTDEMRLFRIERKDDDFRVLSYDYRTLEASLESDWEVR
jgi:AAA15 family ATPase/GTPase